jgi:hypothetical protein
MTIMDKITDGDLQELVDYQKMLQVWVNRINAEVDKARLRRFGKLSLTDHQQWSEIRLKDHVYSLDSVVSMHLKFSMMPGPLFVPKDCVASPDVESLKVEIALIKAKQEESDIRQARMEATQIEMAADLKKLLALLSPKP